MAVGDKSTVCLLCIREDGTAGRGPGLCPPRGGTAPTAVWLRLPHPGWGCHLRGLLVTSQLLALAPPGGRPLARGSASPAPLFLSAPLHGPGPALPLSRGPSSLPAAFCGLHRGMDGPPRARSFRVRTPATASVHSPAPVARVSAALPLTWVGAQRPRSRSPEDRTRAAPGVPVAGPLLGCHQRVRLLCPVAETTILLRPHVLRLGLRNWAQRAQCVSAPPCLRPLLEGERALSCIAGGWKLLETPSLTYLAFETSCWLGPGRWGHHSHVMSPCPWAPSPCGGLRGVRLLTPQLRAPQLLSGRLRKLGLF